MDDSSHLIQNMATNIPVQELYSEEKKTTIEDLLPELLLEIFAWLPAPSILRARGTCKLWNKIMKDPTFFHTHFEHALKNPGYLVYLADVYTYMNYRWLYHVGNNVEGDTDTPDAIQLCHNTRDSNPVRSCTTAGGLILYESCDTDSQLKDSIFLVGNPFTREYMNIPLQNSGNFVLKTVGFGYSPSTKEYKVIKLGLVDDGVIYGAVFTIGCSESWREIPHVPYLPPYNNTVNCDGNIFWEIRVPGWKPYNTAGGRVAIMSFDVASECFRVWRGPPTKRSDFSSRFPRPSLTQIDRSVAYVQWGKPDFIKVWILRADKKEEEWIRKYHIFPYAPFPTSHASSSWIYTDHTVRDFGESEKFNVIGSWINGDLHGVIRPGYQHFSWNSRSGEFKPLTSCFGERVYGKILHVESHVGTLMPLSELVSMARQFRRKGESGSDLPYDQPQ